MRKIKISGYGMSLPKNIVNFNGQIRYRISGDESQLSLAVNACEKALISAKKKIEDIDCIVSASAVGIQPIPCSAALIHEKIAKGLDIPALDINTTCTSFITALDLMSYLIDVGRYKNVLIISSDVSSQALNSKQKESYELFSDGATAFIISATNEEKGIICSLQKTWSEGAHATEIRGGLSAYLPKNYSEATKEEYMFDMNGRDVLSLSIKKLPKMLDEFLNKNNLKISDIDMVIPHQASVAMTTVMAKLNIPENKYINLVSEYGNMVSASVPMTLCLALDKSKIKEGDKIFLIGTAAGLTTNMLYMKV
ncbi:3-oxoacyl-[acyl-carrier-protein] synthase III C-terminal domain-containing protein [Fusobacterium russii]|uniref:3-oxoacyl-[acyl-carrier-protein] synthase III C-terminal domain-containing protein n=1 Tax=Fusobacterium russii TaxID=854 RepID=UPI0003A6B027|nr:3-oxoacyl-[acyl-carrier-protein] synthase III C-terminal domain-containing protein [Fusobacterium russii]